MNNEVFDSIGLVKYLAENPNPRLRVFENGSVQYMNSSGKELKKLLVNDKFSFSDDLLIATKEAIFLKETKQVELSYKKSYFLFFLIPVEEKKYINLYCIDISEQKNVELELLQTRNRLEKVVEERTTEFLKTNSELFHEKKKRKEIEKFNIVNEKMYEIVIENVADLIVWSVDIVTTKFTYISPSIYNVMGFTSEELTGKNFSDFLTPEFNSKLLKILTQALTEDFKGSTSVQYEAFHKNGDTVVLEATVSFIRDENNNPVGIVGVSQDITEKFAIEQKYLKLSRAVEQSHNLVMIVDTSNVVEYVNPKFTKVTGYSKEEIIGKKASILGNRIDDETKRFWEVLRKYGEWHGELYSLKKDGEYYWEFATISSVKNIQGEITHYIKDAVDITKRKAFNVELEKAKERAEQASRSKGIFLANMSHEIRTPMNSIIGFVDMLKRTELSEKQLEYANYLESSSKGLLQIVNDILDFSKLEYKKFMIDIHPFSPKDELEFEVEVFQNTAKERGVYLITYIDPSLPKMLNGDSLRIRQVMNNLISNALKFTPRGGHVLVDIENLSKNDGKCQIYFSVSDTGIGISKKMQEHIFDAFQQEDISTTRLFGGTGLGLSISKDLVKLMGGKLEISSEEKKGSHFFFDLNLKILEPLDNKNELENVNFYDLTIACVTDQYCNNFQVETLRRYLDYISKSVDIVSLDEMVSDEYDLFIFLCNKKNQNKLKKLLNNNLSKPTIVIIDEVSFQDLESCQKHSKIDSTILLPLTLKKINRAILKALKIELNMTPPIEIHRFRNKYASKALVAEDNEINQKLFQSMFDEIGLNIDIAGDGLEAYEMFIQNKYDMVFMDIHMPKMDGVTTTKKILEYEKEHDFKHTPIIALTARAVKGDKETFLSEGMDDYLSKPVDFDSIRKIVQKYINNSLNKLDESNNREEEMKDIPNSHVNVVSEVLGIPMKTAEVIVEEFLSCVDEEYKLVANAIKNENLEEINEAAHKFKGAAANLRYENLANLLLKIEKSTENKSDVNYNELLRDVKYEIEKIKE